MLRALCLTLVACGSSTPAPADPAPAPPPSAEAAPAVSEEDAGIDLDPYQLANLPFTEPAVLKNIRVRSRLCFLQAVREHEEGHDVLGLPRLRLTFDKTGTIKKVKVLCSPLPKTIDACLSDIFLGVSLPSTAAQSVEVGPECPAKK